MRPLTAQAITGTWATPLLPLDEDDHIDWGRLGEQLERILDAGVDGVYTNGSAGEFWTLTEAENEHLAELVAGRCEAAGVPFQLGVGDPSPQRSLERLRRACAWTPGAVQVILPDWFAVSDAEAVAFLRRMAEVAAPVPLVLYNPPHAKRVLPPRSFAQVTTAVPEVVGVKVGGGDAAWYEAMAGTMERVSVFVPGHHLATGYARGAAGAYSNVACLNPAAAVRWWHQIRAGTDQVAAGERSPSGSDPTGSRPESPAGEVERRLQAFMNTHVLPLRQVHGYSNAALDKLLAAVGNWSATGTRLRWPYQWVPTEEADRLRALARVELPEFVTG